jgi:uncharacterized DUF497 family protein
MRFEDDPDMTEWLEQFTGIFDWDSGNSTKNKKHGTEPGDIESVFESPFLLAGRIVEPAHEESRWLLLGTAEDGRELALVFCRRGEKLRPISCRPMRRGERKLFWEVVSR